MEINHFSHEHSLVLCEEKWSREVSCSICGELLFGLSYSCQICPFVLHKWCAELPHELSCTHDLYPPQMLPNKHTLILSRTKYSSNPSHCRVCDYQIKPLVFAYATTKEQHSAKFHVECASFPVGLTRWDAVVPEWFSAKYCSFCQTKDDSPKLRSVEPGGGKTYRHIYCAMLPRTVKHSAHLHELTLHPPLKENDLYFEFVCDACELQRDPAHPIYYCEPCQFVAHIGCGVFGSDPPPIQDILGTHPRYTSRLAEFKVEEEDEEKEEKETKEGDVYGEGVEIEHYFHEHPLAIKYFKELVGLRQEKCGACGQSIFGITYACVEESCDFYLHKWCAQLPRSINCSMHPHHGLLNLEKARSIDPNPRCKFCGMYSEQLHYRCHICDFRIHGLCALFADDLNHQSHEHTLTAVINAAVVYREGDTLNLPLGSSTNPLCQACGFFCQGVALECKSCDFHLHVHCFLVPYTGKHTTHRHDLSLTYSYEEDPIALEFICDTCEKPRTPNRWVYCCPDPKCYIVSHVDCVVTTYFTVSYDQCGDDTTNGVAYKQVMNQLPLSRIPPKNHRPTPIQDGAPILAFIQGLLSQARVPVKVSPTLSKPTDKNHSRKHKHNPTHKVTPQEDRPNHKPLSKSSSKEQTPSTSNSAPTRIAPQDPNKDKNHQELDPLLVIFPDLLKAPPPTGQ